jgi:acetyl esterase/lipase
LVIFVPLLGIAIGLCAVAAPSRPAPADNAAANQAADPSSAQEAYAIPQGAKVERDIVYAKVAGQDLHLDLYTPAEARGPLPVIVWIHGGGWTMGDKGQCPAVWLTAHGYVVASVEYRLAPRFTWPAQIQDCQAAVRFLRANANAKKFGLDGSHIGAWGASAGGHLAVLLGVLGENSPIPATDRHGDSPAESGNETVSSRVQAVCDWFGPTWLAEVQNNNAVEALLGGPVSKNRQKAEQASPLTYVAAGDPPMLIMHGKADTIVPVAASRALYAALRKVGVEAQLEIIPGAGHGAAGIINPQTMATVRQFFDAHLKNQPASQPASPDRVSGKPLDSAHGGSTKAK